MLKPICKMLADMIARLLIDNGYAETIRSLLNRSRQVGDPPTFFGSSTTPYLELSIDNQTILGEYITLDGKTYRVPHFIMSGSSSVAPVVISGVKGTKTFYAAAPTVVAASVLAANPTRLSALFYNAGADDIYLGKDGTVTPATGMKLVAGAALIDGNSADAWFAVMGAGVGDLRIIEVHNP